MSDDIENICSFCLAKQSDRRFLFGPGIAPLSPVFICDKCISYCLLAYSDNFIPKKIPS